MRGVNPYVFGWWGDLYLGDALTVLRTLPDQFVHCVVTSPPYWGLRDYGVDGQIGLEETPWRFVDRLVEVFDEVRRVLRDDGTLWLNLGDSYFSRHAPGGVGANSTINGTATQDEYRRAANVLDRSRVEGLKSKDLIGVPWRAAFALQAAGWYLRQDVIWHKPAPMPESVRDRCTKAHEYLFLLSKSERYFFDADAIAEPASTAELKHPKGWASGDEPHGAAEFRARVGRSGNKERKPATQRGCPSNGVDGNVPWEGTTRNKRSVWTVAPQPFAGAHFATFPEKLVEPCILAGCPEGGTVLDPFAGSGTTLAVAIKHHRKGLGIELNEKYCEIARQRIGGRLDETALFNMLQEAAS